MTRSEMAILLGLMAGRDNRKVDETMVAAWFEDAGDLDPNDARAAVAAWYRQTRERMMPADLRAGVRLIREERARLERPEHRALPGKHEDDVARSIRMERGMAQCQSVVSAVMERLAAARRANQPELTESELIHKRALERARAAKKGRRA